MAVSDAMDKVNDLIPIKARIRWAHVAWITMFCSILIWGRGELQVGTLGNTGNWYRISLVLFSATVGIFVLLRNAGRLLQAFSGPIILFLVYGLAAILSSLYIPQYSYYSMWKALEVIVDVILIVAILSYRAPLGEAILAYKIIIAFFAIKIVLYWVEAMIMPSQAMLRSPGYIPFQLHGVLPVQNPNGVGFLGSTVTFASICCLMGEGRRTVKLMAFFLLGPALAALIFSQSRTGLIELPVALCVYLFFERRYKSLLTIGVILAISLAFTDLVSFAEVFFRRGQNPQLFASLSGRTIGWRAAWASFQESPILGHGFAAAARAQILGTTGASTLHGTVFDVLVGVGLVGLIPWALGIIWTSARLLRLRSNRHPWFRTRQGRGLHSEMLGMLSLILVRSVTASALAMHEHGFMLFLAVLAYASATLHATSRRAAVETQELVPERARRKAFDRALVKQPRKIINADWKRA
jgi:O-antigen ligase